MLIEFELLPTETTIGPSTGPIASQDQWQHRQTESAIGPFAEATLAAESAQRCQFPLVCQLHPFLLVKGALRSFKCFLGIATGKQVAENSTGAL